MPNWVKNHVTCDDGSLKKMYKQNDDGVVEFDFEVVLPMPKELSDDRLSTYPLSDEAKALVAENEKKYGAGDWYHWRVKNWGTKWNAGEALEHQDNYAEFDTAWSTPEPIIKAMSKKFHAKIRVRYADEDLGSNCGEYEYTNGHLTYRKVFEGKTDEAVKKRMFDFACDVWGLDPEEERAWMEGA